MPMDWKKAQKFVASANQQMRTSGDVPTNMFAPPPSYQQSSTSRNTGFLSSTGVDMVTATMQYGMNARKRQLNEDEYLEDEDPSEADLEYTPAPGSPSAENKNHDEDDDEDDPLDAYMAGIEVVARKDKEVSEKRAVEPTAATTSKEKDIKSKLGRTDIEDEDDNQESYRV